MVTVPNSQPKILIVEDTFISAEYVKLVLAQKGFDVLVCSTAASGFDAAVRMLPDLILLDVMLPDGDGFTLCERMKAEPLLAETPIVFVTSLEDVKSRVRGLSIGAVDFITKPFAAEEIVARVRVHVKIARQSRKLAAVQSERLAALKNAHRLFLTNPESVPEARCKVYYEAAEEAGGDQYDVVGLGTGIFGFLVADIAGHGIETVFQASALKTLFRENASVLDSPSETFSMMNRTLKHYLADGQHLTAFYLILNRPAGTATFACAGHPPALAVAADGEVSRLSADGDVLGAFADPRFRTETVKLESGSRIWLFTDGMIEDFAAKRSWRAGLKALERAVSAAQTLPLPEAVESVRAALVPAPGSDDRVLMGVDV